MKRIFLIYFLLASSMAGVNAQACLHDLTLTGTYTTVYTKSDTWIKSSGITTIPTGANVTWDANPLAGVNGYVELNDGFETMPGSEFLAIVEAICVQNPLPIKLISFEAKAQENQVQLTWTTSKETNSAGFEIERSQNGKDFTKIGFVKSEANKGNSYESLGYVFIDESPNLENNYYRLKQLDLDGKFEYSKIKSVIMENEDAIKVFPNPTSDFVKIETHGTKIRLLELLDAKGSVVFKANNVQTNIDLTGKSPGIYFLKIVKENGKVEVKKVLKN